MNTSELLNELKSLKNYRESTLQKIKQHNRPVILYGAALMAKLITEVLDANDIPIAGYAVDDKYYQIDENYLNRPVFRVSDVLSKADKFVFIPALSNDQAGLKILHNDKLICYSLDMSPELIDYNYVEEHVGQFIKTFNYLDDDISQKTFVAYLKTKISGDVNFNEAVYHSNQYFNELTYIPTGGVLVDCGAYIGDTIEDFINWTNGNYNKIYAFEADFNNFAVLQSFIQEKRYNNVDIFNLGVWNKKDKLHFDSRNNCSSSIDDVGNSQIYVDALDNVIDDKVDFIKMDIEGSELQALQGAANIIRQNMPLLAICVYHKADDLIKIPQYIKKINPKYKCYLREHKSIVAEELVWYAINN